MTTYHDLEIGVPFSTPSRVIDDATVRGLIEIGGYTHPLFTDPEYAASSAFGRTPLPGEGILHVMGGLAEASGKFDETVIALTGFESVRFLKPAFAGDELRVEIEVTGKEPAVGRGTLTMRWRCVNGHDEVVVDAVARMLFRI